MRLCGHDRVVSDRYDSGSVGSGERTWRYTGTEKELICNARDTRAIVYPSRSVREPPEKSAQGGSLGAGSAPYIGFIQATDPERHWATVLDTARHTKRGSRNDTGQPCEASQALTRSARQPTNRSQSDNWHTSTQILTHQGLPLTHRTSETRNATGSLQSDQSLDIDPLCQVHSVHPLPSTNAFPHLFGAGSEADGACCPSHHP